METPVHLTCASRGCAEMSPILAYAMMVTSAQKIQSVTQPASVLERRYYVTTTMSVRTTPVSPKWAAFSLPTITAAMTKTHALRMTGAWKEFVSELPRTVTTEILAPEMSASQACAGTSQNLTEHLVMMVTNVLSLTNANRVDVLGRLGGIATIAIPAPLTSVLMELDASTPHTSAKTTTHVPLSTVKVALAASTPPNLDLATMMTPVL